MKAIICSKDKNTDGYCRVWILSNRQEAELLSDAEYQQKVAVAISKGIENYLNEEAKSAKKP